MIREHKRKDLEDDFRSDLHEDVKQIHGKRTKNTLEKAFERALKREMLFEPDPEEEPEDDHGPRTSLWF